jgi:hypothetical protein
MMNDEVPSNYGGGRGTDDMTEATINVDLDGEFPVGVGEASFPAAEEIRSSSTSRNRSSIWPGASTGTMYNKKKKRYLWTILIALPLVVLLIIVPAVVVSNNKKSSSSDKSNVEAQSRPRPAYDDVVNFIVTNQISSESAFDDSASPQSQAATWLSQTDGANLPVPDSDLLKYDAYMYMVRYVMAVNYYSLGGPNWKVQHNWLTNMDVCDWNDLVVVDSSVHRLGLRCARYVEGDERVYLPYQLFLGKFYLCGCCVPIVL